MTNGSDSEMAKRLRDLGVRGMLVQMAENGQIPVLRCEMPMCYCEKGRRHFDKWPDPKHALGHEWSPNPDHYPRLKMDMGKLTPSNVRLAHVACNNLDSRWRKRVRTMLEEDPTLSFRQIADALNRKKSVYVPPEAKSWTARLVRKAYTS